MNHVDNVPSFGPLTVYVPSAYRRPVMGQNLETTPINGRRGFERRENTKIEVGHVTAGSTLYPQGEPSYLYFCTSFEVKKAYTRSLLSVEDAVSRCPTSSNM